MTEIIRTYEDLEALVKKNYVAPDLMLIKKAYDVAAKAHEGETRFTRETTLCRSFDFPVCE